MKLVKRAAAVLAGVVVLALAIVYGGSEWILRRSHAVPLTQLQIPHDAASIAEGGRLAVIGGCRGCHGPNGQGLEWSNDWIGGRIAPPAIARKIANYSDAELERLIRHGVRKDGSAIFIMSSPAFSHWADDDTAKLIAWLRTLKPLPNDLPGDTAFGIGPRFAILTGAFPSSLVVERVAPVHRPADIGRYFYQGVCADCHRLDRTNNVEGQTVPALAPIAAAYPPEAFHRLLRTGIGLSKPNLGLMTDVAKESTHAFTDAEIAAIQNYLKGEAEKLPPQ